MVDLLYDPGLTSHQQLVSRVLSSAAGARTSRQYRAVILCHDSEQAPSIPSMMACHAILGYFYILFRLLLPRG